MGKLKKLKELEKLKPLPPASSLLTKKGNADRLRGVCIAFMLYCCGALAVLPLSVPALSVVCGLLHENSLACAVRVLHDVDTLDRS